MPRPGPFPLWLLALIVFAPLASMSKRLIPLGVFLAAAGVGHLVLVDGDEVLGLGVLLRESLPGVLGIRGGRHRRGSTEIGAAGFRNARVGTERARPSDR